MPATYRIDTQRGIVFGTAWGILTRDEVDNYVLDLMADPDFHPNCLNLFDALLVEELDMTTSDIQRIGSYELFRPETRQAYLAEKDRVYGIAQMIGDIQQRIPNTVAVCRTENEAFQWLGIENRRRPPTAFNAMRRLKDR